MTFYHGGKAGLNIGDRLVPSPPHVDDGCPVCEARKIGRVCTVGEFRRWLRQFGAQGERALRALSGADDSEPMDPPSAERAVYITTSEPYATWYAATRGHGDVYQVKPDGETKPTHEDSFPAWTVASARIVRVVRRGVYLTRTERRTIERLWKKADERKETRAHHARL
jgi:hypothetical protein